MIAIDQICENYHRVLERIGAAALSSGREPQSVRLIVVTKTHPLETVQAIATIGANHLGENYAEEAAPKIQALAGVAKVEWHMIGHVQSRKAELVCELFHYLHSLDSLKLAGRLDRFAREKERKLPVLLEFNVSGEASKFGWPAWDEALWSALLPEMHSIVAMPNLEVRGLMCMAPFLDEAELARPYFRKLRRLQDYLRQQVPQADWRELSMGMSSDFEVAIQEGATWVRIGQSILGPRTVG